MLEGKVLIVSGAASGIAQGLSTMAAAQGASVVCADINDPGVTVERITAAGGTAIGVHLDVRKEVSWQEVVERTVAEYGGVDLLGNIAGIVNQFGPDTVTDIDPVHWHDIIATDLDGVWLGMRTVIPEMKKRGGGRIVNISSMAALRGLPNLAAYTAAKGGVAALTRQAAVEYAPDNILINAIAPGTVNTPILKDTTPPMMEAFTQAHAVKRLGTPADISAMALHFFNEESGSWLTGAVMPVDGGWHVT